MLSPLPLLTERLRETVAALEDAVGDGGQTAFAFLDTDLRFRYLNDAMAQMHGAASAAELLGKPAAVVVGSENWPLIAEPLESARAGHTVRDLLVSPVHTGAPDGPRHLLSTYLPVRSGGKIAGVAVVVRERIGHDEAEQIRRESAQRERQFMRDVLASVTGGRLLLCTSPDELPRHLPLQGAPVPVTRHGGIRDLRLRAEAAASSLGFASAGWFDMETAIGEAAMNALIHAGGGISTVCAGEPGRLQVWMTDTGTGIAFEHLPRATLEKGFTTAGTLGHGFKMILKTADRVHLLTGATGTTVVLEKDRDTPSAIPSPLDDW